MSRCKFVLVGRDKVMECMRLFVQRFYARGIAERERFKCVFKTELLILYGQIVGICV